METIEEIRKDNKVLKIFVDEDPDNPREWDNLGIIAYKHNRYTLGEEQINDPIEWLEEKLNLKNKGIYTNERLKDLETLFFKKFIALELYLYEHSGISLSCSPFSCPWDSGKVGYIYTTKEKAKEEGLTKKKCLKVLEGEINTFNNYLTGEVYGFTLIEEILIKQTTITEYPKGKKEKSIINTTEEKDLDSCWGFYGDEGIKQIKEETGF